MFDQIDQGRDCFTEDHRIFRGQVRDFVAREMKPRHAKWEQDKQVERDIWLKAGAMGLLCPTAPEELGGGGGDFLHALIILEEMTRAQCTGPGFLAHSEMVVPYIIKYGNDHLRSTYLDRLISGELISCVAMTEPHAGTDLRRMKTRAKRQADGSWKLSGSKIYISNGFLADLAVVAAQTEVDGRDRLSLFVVETGWDGYVKGRKLDKLGSHASDTAELYFDEVTVPADHLLGELGQGLTYLRNGLVRERIMIAANSVARAELALELTLDQVKDRDLFGQKLWDFQNTKFVLADVATEVTMARRLIDGVIADYMERDFSESDAARLKLWCTDMIWRVADKCLQFHGGSAYMADTPMAKLWVACRAEKLVGGSSETMRDLISRSL